MTKEQMFNEDWLNVCADDTLPPGYVKFLCGETATVFELDLETETGRPIASWPELATKRAQR